VIKTDRIRRTGKSLLQNFARVAREGSYAGVASPVGG
jgi:hypothetical protein